MALSPGTPKWDNIYLYIYIYIVYTSFGNLASKMSSHFCKFFFLWEIVSVRGAFWGLINEKSWFKICYVLLFGSLRGPLLYCQLFPDVKRQEMIYHQSIYPCVPSLNLLDCKEDKNWWWSRRLKNAMSLHCPKRIPSIVLRKHLPQSPKNNRIPLKIEDTPLILLHHSMCFTAHSANS